MTGKLVWWLWSSGRRVQIPESVARMLEESETGLKLERQVLKELENESG